MRRRVPAGLLALVVAASTFVAGAPDVRAQSFACLLFELFPGIERTAERELTAYLVRLKPLALGPANFRITVHTGLGNVTLASVPVTAKVTNPRNVGLGCATESFSYKADVAATAHTPSYLPDVHGSGVANVVGRFALEPPDRVCPRNVRLTALNLSNLPGAVDDWARGLVNDSSLVNIPCQSVLGLSSRIARLRYRMEARYARRS